MNQKQHSSMEIASTPDTAAPNTLLGVKLNAGISKLNLITYFLIQLATWINIYFIWSFLTFILSDPKYYAIDSAEVPFIIGLSAMASQMCVTA